MDVEGAEAFLLPALAPWLQSLPRKPPIWLSTHRGHYPRGEHDLHATLAAANSVYRFAYSEHMEAVNLSNVNDFGGWCGPWCSVLLSSEPVALSYA